MLKKLEENSWFLWALFIIAAGSIFYLSSMTFPTTDTGTPNILATLYHFLAFFLFTMLLYLTSIKRRKLKLGFYLVIIISILYAILDELHQFFVPGRFMSLIDIIVNIAGIMYASLVYLVLIIKESKA
jgi:hypothetical protein